MAYLQDASPYFDDGFELKKVANPSSPTSPMGSAIELHMDAALRLKHARFSKLTLTFKNSSVEGDYEEYFWSRTVQRWRLFLLVASSIVIALQIAGLLGRNGDGLEGASAVDWVILGFAAVLPLVAIVGCSYFVSNAYMSRWIHHLSLLFLLVVGPVLTIIRYTNSRLHTSSDSVLISPSVTAPLYIVCLVSSVFFLRLRFLHTLAATLVAAPTWYAVFSSSPNVDKGEYFLPSLALFFACIVTCFIAYDLERSYRIQYLSDSRFLSITRNLQSQLDGLEKSLLAASGKNGLTPADLDSPLEKAMLAVRSLLLDASLQPDHKNVLDVVMACLSSPNLLTPDLDVQLREGQVAIDDEQEKWLFKEIAKRSSKDPADAGQQQVLPDRSDLDEEFVTIDLDFKVNASATQSRRNSAVSMLTPTRVLSPASIVELYTTSTISLLARVSEYNFPIFEFADNAQGHPLLIMAHHLCVTNGVIHRLGINVDKFINCIATIESGYHADLTFHNSLHAADVLHCINYLVQKPSIRLIFSDLEVLAIYVAAVIHDFDHPGLNNNFLIASSDRKALLYNDKSVLENHHCAAAFEVLSRSQCAFLSTLDRADYKVVRESIVEMVLATDLSQHFSVLSMFKKKVLSAESFEPLSVREDRTLLMQMLMKCADVSNPTKAWPEYIEWIDRLTEEWYMQGDKEKALGLPISPFMNRDGPNASNPASSQTGFINFIVAPLFDAFGAWADVGEIRRALEANKAKWAAAPGIVSPAAVASSTATPSNDGKVRRKSGAGPHVTTV
ncbi:hypothetical protein DFJ73DRAFT_761398 [Zopfochytrium polystomum]|nr:hypothetical protein DFJ73DRAFT_761398 [Zopfochytrium polystomum]